MLDLLWSLPLSAVKGEHACASANGGAELLQPLHYEESCRYQTAHVGEQWEVAEASKVSEATCIIYADADGTEGTRTT